MRLVNNNNFTIESNIINSKNLQQVRKILPELFNEDADIIIFAGQAGVGKSRATMEFMENNENSMLLTSKHSLLIEFENYFISKQLDHKHWYGVNHSMSPCHQKHTKLFQDLVRLGYTTQFICSEVLKCEHCEYRKQFKSVSRVLAPVQYLQTSYLENDGNYRFNTYIIDESIMDFAEYPYDLDYIIEVVRPLYFFGSHWMYEFLVKLLNSKDLEGLEAYSDKIEHEVKNALKSIHELIKEHGNSETEAWEDDIKKLSKFNIYDIIKSLKFQRMYNNEIDAWTEPSLYKIFDIAQGAKVVLLNATFNESVFEDMLSSYSAEIGITKKIRVKIFYTQLSNKDTKVYRVNPNAYFPSFTLDRGGIKEISNHVHVIANQIGAENVGVVSLSKYNKIGSLIDETFLDTGLDSLHFGGSKGRNTLESKKCLVISGSFINGGTVDIYNSLYLDQLKQDDCKSKKVENGKIFEYDPILHPKLNLVQHVLNEGEIIDAYNRNRGLIHPNRSIVSFSHIPEQIYHDFDVIEDKRIELTDWKTIYPKAEVPVYELVRDYLENSDKTDSEIAEELNIVKDESYDVELVGRMRRHYEESKEFGI